MPDPTTPAKGLTQPLVGGDNNAWGGLLNTDLSLIDSALGGTLALSISTNTTLTSTQAQNTGYEFTGTLSGTATITWPSFSGLAAIQNDTSAGHSISCGISGGTFVTILNGETVAVWSDGANFARLAQVGGGATVSNADLQNSSITIAGHSVSLGGTQALAASDLTNGTTGSGDIALATSPTIASPTLSGTASGTLIWANHQYFESGRPWADVRAYGATGNGSTDDTAAFNAALTALGSLGGGASTLFIPAGNYVLASGITINTSLRIVGANRATTLLQTGGNDVTPLSLNAPYCTVEHLSIFGKGQTTDTAGGTHPALEVTSSGVECLLSDLLLQYGSSPLQIDGTDVIIFGCKTQYGYGTANITDNGGANHYIRVKADQNWPVSEPSAGFASSITAWSSSMTATLGEVVSLPSGSRIQCSQAGTAGSTAPNVPVYGVAVTDGAAKWMLAIPDGSSGIFADVLLTSSVIEHDFTACDFSGSFDRGISVSGTSLDLKITDCVFSQYLTGGIFIAAGSFASIKGCEIVGGLLTVGFGIRVTNMAGICIEGNQFSGPGADGVRLSTALCEAVINGNQFNGWTSAAVAVDAGVSGFIVANNMMYASNTGSVVVASGSSDYYNIVNNIVHGVAVSDGGSGTHKTISGNN